MLHKKLAVIFPKYSVQHNSSPMKNHLGISDITFVRVKQILSMKVNPSLCALFMYL